MTSRENSLAFTADTEEPPFTAEADHGHSDLVLYAEVFGLLAALTVLTVTMSYVNVGAALDVPQLGRSANIIAGLLVAFVKAGLVVWIFMHMNHETKVNRFVFIFALCLLGVFFIATALDFEWLGTYVVDGAKALVGT
jgi:caa(3)-type oxidase subunit IV